jgi:hypothetical protein
VSMGERIAMEIAKAAKDGRLHEIVTWCEESEESDEAKESKED